MDYAGLYPVHSVNPVFFQDGTKRSEAGTGAEKGRFTAVLEASDRLPKGTKTFTKGFVRLPKGREIILKGREMISKGTKTFPKGTKMISKGRETFPKGTKIFAKGFVRFSKGTKIITKGTEIILKGTKTLTKVTENGFQRANVAGAATDWGRVGKNSVGRLLTTSLQQWAGSVTHYCP